LISSSFALLMSETRFNLNAFAAKWLRTSRENLPLTR
jgi:hypothetical protein